MRIELMTFPLQRERSKPTELLWRKKGQNWESNPGPLAPKARIIPLDHSGIMHRPGIEPGSLAWKANILTTIPTMHISTTGLEPVT